MSRVSMLFALMLAALPATARGQATMDQLWPNDDGRQWRYTQRYQNLFFPHTQDDEVRLVFDGLALAPTAIEVQYLKHEFISGAPSPYLLASGITDPLLHHVWLARPDLREKLGAFQGVSCPGFAPPGPHGLLLGGEFAWQKTAGEIVAWRCNLANTRSWQWLIADLTPGTEFTLQLIPDLASDVFLHGTIGPLEPANVPAGSFPDCVRVDYVVDYGTSECVDFSGIPIGTSRAETRGYIRWAPNVGPVESFEEFIPYADVVGTCGDPAQNDQPSARYHLRLQAQPVAARVTTWGAVKVIYR